jgi:hypothetical protein
VSINPDKTQRYSGLMSLFHNELLQPLLLLFCDGLLQVSLARTSQ